MNALKSDRSEMHNRLENKNQMLVNKLFEMEAENLKYDEKYKD